MSEVKVSGEKYTCEGCKYLYIETTASGEKFAACNRVGYSIFPDSCGLSKEAT